MSNCNAQNKVYISTRLEVACLISPQCLVKFEKPQVYQAPNTMKGVLCKETACVQIIALKVLTEYLTMRR